MYGSIKKYITKSKNIKTKEIYKSAKECAKQNNIKYPTLANRLNGNKKNNTNFKYLGE